MKETEKARNAKGKPGKCGDTGAKGRMLRRGGLTVPAFNNYKSSLSYPCAKTIHKFLVKGNKAHKPH